MRKAYLNRNNDLHGNGFLTAVVPSSSLREIVLRAYIKRGWKYFVKFHDVNGFGLQACRRAVWQNDKSPISIQ